MFIAHFGVGFGAKSAGPRISLGTLFLSAQFVDLLWPTLLILGLENVEIVPGITKITPLDFVSYPISHSLLLVCMWGVLFGTVYAAVRKSWRGAAILTVCVISHWLLDLIVHRPDLPLYPGSSTLVGFGVWDSTGGTLVLEGLIFASGLALYLRTTTAINKTGRYSLWGLVVFLVLVYAGNLLGPPPPNTTAIAWVGQLQWLLVLWAYWVDRNRSLRPNV